MKQGILLCVDDEVIVLSALRDQLRKAYGSQHLIEIAESAEEGLEILDELTGQGLIPLVVISDFQMPGMKGDEFLIQASRRFPYVVTVMLSGQVSGDAKSGLAYATISQVGLMFVEVGLGLPKLALLHLAAHSLLRYYQFLRTPSTLQDALYRRRAGGQAAMAFQAQAASPRQRFLYRLAIERFAIEAVLDRWVARPLLSLARALGRREDALVGWLMGDSQAGKDQGHGN